jgi:hypothetical protein
MLSGAICIGLRHGWAAVRVIAGAISKPFLNSAELLHDAMVTHKLAAELANFIRIGSDKEASITLQCVGSGTG